MSLRAPALALCGLLACSGPADPPPLPATPAAKPITAPAAAPAIDDGKVSLLPAQNGPAPAKEPPLTQEEIDLIAADPASLTPDMRRKRAFALRRKVLQNPDSPTARQLEALRVAFERGELQPQLPDHLSSDGGITLHARQPATPEPATPEPKKTP